MFAKRQTNKSNTELKCILIKENKIKKSKRVQNIEMHKFQTNQNAN